MEGNGKSGVRKKGTELGIHLDLKKSIFQMTPAQKKCVEILRAMMSDCKLMILDEPTASLSDKETNLLFSIIRNLKAKGTAVLYVTHRLEEIMALTDRVTVLRNGELVSNLRYSLYQPEGAGPADEREWEADSEHMVPDSTCPVHRLRQPSHSGTPALTISHLSSADHIVKDASITVHTGRITGMFGLCGSGRTEFLECIYGIRRISGGTIEISGENGEKAHLLWIP